MDVPRLPIEKSNSVDENKQITLKNDCKGLEDRPLLQKFAEKLQDGFEITLTPKEVKKLVVYLNTLKHGFSAAVPLICTGEQCPYSIKCPLGGNNNYPMGKECPIESTLVEVWYNDYVTELGVNPESKVDSALVGDVVFWEILEKRATEELAKKPEVLRKQIVGFQDTKEGPKALYREEMNQIFTFLEKAQRQKMKVLNALIATREAKSKDAGRIIADPSTYAAKLLQRVKDLDKEAERVEAVDAEVVKDEESRGAS